MALDQQAFSDFDAAIRGGAYGWAPYVERGRSAEELGRWDQAIADYTRTIQEGGGGWKAWHRRGESQSKKLRRGEMAEADLGRGEMAEADLVQAIERGADQPVVWQQLALLRLVRRDLDAYRKTCASMFNRFGQASDPIVAREVVNTCTLIPGALPDLAPILRMAEEAVAGDPESPILQAMLGRALYRAGQYQLAIGRLEEARRGQRHGDEIDNWLFLAMAHSRLGHSSEARGYLSKATQAHLTASIGVEALSDEATALILDPTFPVNPFAY